MALLDSIYFDSIFSPLKGCKVGWLKMIGNPGDHLINWSTLQMLNRYDIQYGVLNCQQEERLLEQIDTIIISGGGNLGRFYNGCYQLRQRYLNVGKRTIVLPQSLTDDDENLEQYDKVYFREKDSLEQFPAGELAPDLALGFESPFSVKSRTFSTGVFLREDDEKGNFTGVHSIGDPAMLYQSVTEYLAVSSKFETIFTDRLHFAIAAMISGCETFILPGKFKKNRAMYETWLKDLGMQWCNDYENIHETRPTFNGHTFRDLTRESVNKRTEPEFILTNGRSENIIELFITKPVKNENKIRQQATYRKYGQALTELWVEIDMPSGQDASCSAESFVLAMLPLTLNQDAKLMVYANHLSVETMKRLQTIQEKIHQTRSSENSEACIAEFLIINCSPIEGDYPSISQIEIALKNNANINHLLLVRGTNALNQESRFGIWKAELHNKVDGCRVTAISTNFSEIYKPENKYSDLALEAAVSSIDPCCTHSCRFYENSTLPLRPFEKLGNRQSTATTTFTSFDLSHI